MHLSKFAAVAALGTLGTWGTIAAAQELTYLDALLAYSDQESGADTEAGGFVEAYFDFGNLTVGGLLGYAQDVDEEEILDSQISGVLGFTVTPGAYLQVELFRFEDADDTVNASEFLGEFAAGDATFGAAYYSEDTDFERVAFYAGLDTPTGDFIAGEVRLFGVDELDQGYFVGVAETSFGRVDAAFSGGFGFNDNDIWEALLALDFSVTEEFSIIGGIGAFEINSNDESYTSIGVSYDIGDGISTQLLYSAEFDNDETFDTIGIALNWDLGFHAVYERIDDIQFNVGNVVRAYD